MATAAKTVEAYLAALPDDRRRVLTSVRALIQEHLPAGYAEAINWGMIAYEIPLARYPDTYNGQPLTYAALAAQKQHVALYLMAVDLVPGAADRLRADFARDGKTLDMGKSCVRFKRLEDISLPAVAAAIASLTPEAYIAHHEASRAGADTVKKSAARNAAARDIAAEKSAAKKVAAKNARTPSGKR